MGKRIIKKIKKLATKKVKENNKPVSQEEPILRFNCDEGNIDVEFKDGRKITIQFDGLEFAAFLLKVTNEIHCYENKTEDRDRVYDLGYKLQEYHKLLNDIDSGLGINDKEWVVQFKRCTRFQTQPSVDATWALSEVRTKLKAGFESIGITQKEAKSFVDKILPGWNRKSTYPMDKIDQNGKNPFSEGYKVIPSKDGSNIQLILEWAGGKLKIPEGVTRLEADVFKNCKKMTSIVIPKSVVFIKGNIFTECEKLEHIEVADGNPVYMSVNGMILNKEEMELISVPRGIKGDIQISEDVKKIGDSAFSRCTGMTSITIPESVTKIGNWTFRCCIGLKGITIPGSVTEIGDWAFSDCSGLTYIKISEKYSWDEDIFDIFNDPCCSKLWSIGEYAFEGCRNLKSITMPKGIVRISDFAFSDCVKLERISIPSSVMEIGRRAFERCEELKDIIMEKGIRKIEDGAFYCSGLTSISIPESVFEIGDEVFLGCERLTNIIFPRNLRILGLGAFCYCTSLEGIYFNGDAPEIYLREAGAIDFEHAPYSIEDTIDYDNVHAKVYYLKGSRGWYSDFMSFPTHEVEFIPEIVNGEIRIPGNVTKIGKYAFQGCIKLLTSITIPNWVTEIGERAFFGCNHLKSITIPTNVTEIGKEAFGDCTGLESVTISEGVIKIGWRAFSGCGRLKSITIPKSVTEIGEGAFRKCSSITVNSKTPKYISIDGVLFNKDKTTLLHYPYLKKEAIYTIPGGVTKIGDSAFVGCESLTSITIPEGVTKIGTSAFESVGLTSIIIPKSVNEIGDSAFSGCESLTSITIPEGVTKIGDNVFNFCAELINIIIPESVTRIGSGAFAYTALTSITIPKGVTEIGEGAFESCGLQSIAIPEGVTKIERGTFKECTELNCITIPECVTEIGEYAFENCIRLENIVIPRSVTKIGKYAFAVDEFFAGDSSLTSITIPEGVIEIEKGTFEGCTRLKNITIPRSVTKIGENAFRRCMDLTSITIPEGVAEIGKGTFRRCTELESITIPKSVKYIGWHAFNNCTSLKKIYFEGDKPHLDISISENVQATVYYLESAKGWKETFGGLPTKEMPDPSFEKAKKQHVFKKYGVILSEDGTEIKLISKEAVGEQMIPDGVTKLCGDIFERRKEITSIIIPKSVTFIDKKVFFNCEKLEYIEVAEENPMYASSNGILLNKEKTKIIYVPRGINGSLCIPECINEIEDWAFYGRTRLKKIAIPKSVTKIGNWAFRDCSGLTGIIIPKSVEIIMPYAFMSCAGLKKITIPNGVTGIGWAVFAHCSELKSVTLPDSVSYINRRMFYNCTGLTSIMIPKSVNSICDLAFYNCSSLKEIHFEGDAPNLGLDVFDEVSATVYYQKGTKGWGKTFGGLPTKEML